MIVKYLIFFILFFTLILTLNPMIKCCEDNSNYPICPPGRIISELTFNNGEYAPNIAVQEIHVWSDKPQDYLIQRNIFNQLQPLFNCRDLRPHDTDPEKAWVTCDMKSIFKDQFGQIANVERFHCSMDNFQEGHFRTNRDNKNKRINSGDSVFYSTNDILNVVITNRDLKITYRGETPVNITIYSVDKRYKFDFIMYFSEVIVSLPDSEIYIESYYFVVAYTKSGIIRTGFKTERLYECVTRRNDNYMILDYVQCQYSINKKNITWIFIGIGIIVLIYFMLKNRIISRFVFGIFKFVYLLRKIRAIDIILCKIQWYLGTVKEKELLKTKLEKEKEENKKLKRVKKDLESGGRFFALDTKYKDDKIIDDDLNRESMMMKAMKPPDLSQVLTTEEIKETRRANSFDSGFLGLLSTGHMILVEYFTRETLNKILDEKVTKEEYKMSVGLSKYKPMNVVVSASKFLKESYKSFKERFATDTDKVVFTKKGIFKILIYMSLIIAVLGNNCAQNIDFTLQENKCNEQTNICRRVSYSEFVFTSVGESYCFIYGTKNKVEQFVRGTLLSSVKTMVPTFSYLTSEVHLNFHSATHCRWTIFQNEDICPKYCESNSHCEPQRILNMRSSLNQPCETGCLTDVLIANQDCFFNFGCVAFSEAIVPYGAQFRVFGGFTSSDNAHVSVTLNENGVTKNANIKLDSGVTRELFNGELRFSGVESTSAEVLRGKCLLYSIADQRSSDGRVLKKGDFFLTDCNPTGGLTCDKIGSLQINNDKNLMYNMGCVNKVLLTNNQYQISQVDPVRDFLVNGVNFKGKQYKGHILEPDSDGKILIHMDTGLDLKGTITSTVSYSSVVETEFEAKLEYIAGSMRGFYNKPDNTPYFLIGVKSIKNSGTCTVGSSEVNLLTKSVLVEEKGQVITIDFSSSEKSVNFKMNYYCNGIADTIDISGVLSSFNAKNYSDNTIVINPKAKDSGFHLFGLKTLESYFVAGFMGFGSLVCLILVIYVISLIIRSI